MKALKQLYIAILVLVVGLILIPLFKTESTTQELKGFSARDIQFIESIGFVDNLDGSWSITINNNLTPRPLSQYYFDYKPLLDNGGLLQSLTVVASNTIRVSYDGFRQDYVNVTIILWGGDVS